MIMRIFLLTIFVMFIFGCNTQTEINIESLIERDGILFKPNETNTFTGIAFDIFSNGQKKLEYSIKKGRKNGSYKQWDKSGNLLESGTYVDGIKDGQWILYRDNNKKHEINYVNGIEDGKCISWNENGDVIEEGYFKNGKKEGKWYGLKDDGQKYYECYFSNGSVDFKKAATFWYVNGKLREQLLPINEIQFKQTQWNENGVRVLENIWAKSPLYNSPYIGLAVHGSDLNISQSDFIKLKSFEWYPSGKIKAETSMSLQNRRNGRWVEYYENGEMKSEQNWTNGIRNGFWLERYSDGQLKEKGYYNNDNKEGKWEEWYSNGSAYTVYNWSNGKISNQNYVRVYDPLTQTKQQYQSINKTQPDDNLSDNMGIGSPNSRTAQVPSTEVLSNNVSAYGTEVKSEQIKSNGDPTGKNYTGSPRNFGVRLLNIPAHSIEDEFNENAKVAMDIVTDENGKVISATYQPRGTTTSNPKMIDIARKYAFSLKGNGTGDGVQKGTVIFNFKVRN